jgi:uncharacterized protein (TIGR04255 family)
MSLLPSAPLIEAIFSANWGKLPEGTTFPRLTVNGNSQVLLNYTQEQAVILSSKFATEIATKGFSEIQAAPPVNPMLGPAAQLRFYQPGNASKIYQIGLGLFCVNYMNEGYRWSSFKNMILEGSEAFIKVFPGGIETTDIVTIELRYRDALKFEEGETAFDFLEKKMLVKLVTPEGLFSLDGLDHQVIGSRLNFGVACSKPKGVYVLDLVQSGFPTGPGYVLDTVIKSSINEGIKMESAFLSQWLEEAHSLQKHSFESVISSAHVQKEFNK